MASPKEHEDLAEVIDGPGASPKAGDAPTGVRRVNNMPLLIIGGILVIFVILVAMVAAKRGAPKQEATTTAAPLSESSQALDQLLAHAALGGIIEDPDSTLQTPSFAVARPEDFDKPPLPETPAEVEDPNAAERMKLFQTAMRAKSGITQVVSSMPTHKVDAEERDAATNKDPSEVDKRIPIHADGDYAQFDRSGRKKPKGDDRWALDSSLENPRTRYEVRAGAIIPAIMISGINSELPGQIIGQVSQDVFDTPTGKFRLIPQGARLIGRYSSRIVDGQSRVLVAWQRIVFPDGKALDIGSMEGVDGAGYAGFTDKVDRHYWRTFGAAFLMSGIATGLTSSRVTPDNDPFGSSTAAQFNERLANQIGDVATRMIEKNMNIAPTLMIRPGYRFNVMAVKDLAFDQPYRAFDY
jgi:type IV secretion system protein TrbI